MYSIANNDIYVTNNFILCYFWQVELFNNVGHLKSSNYKNTKTRNNSVTFGQILKTSKNIQLTNQYIQTTLQAKLCVVFIAVMCTQGKVPELIISIITNLEVYVLQQVKGLSVETQIQQHLRVVHIVGQLSRRREVTERHHLFGAVDNH